jgi:hypothetical protein
MARADAEQHAGSGTPTQAPQSVFTSLLRLSGPLLRVPPEVLTYGLYAPASGPPAPGPRKPRDAW